jgi:hypothetical protein
MKKCYRSLLNSILLLALLNPSICQAQPEATLPEGTKITLQLNTKLSTRDNRIGDSFTAVVTKPVNLGKRTIIPKGTVVNGSISRILSPGKFEGKSQMDLRFQSIDIPGHKRIDIVATLIKTESQGKISEGVIKSREKNISTTAGQILLPSAIGGAMGAIIGGSGRAAGIGAGAGAIVGGAVSTLDHGGEKEVELKLGSTLEIALNQPLVIPAEEQEAAAPTR